MIRRTIKPALLARLVATGFGVGRVPMAPGTAGSLAALPIAWMLVSAGGPWLLALAAALLAALGLWAVQLYMAELGQHDPASVVIDEVIGQWITLLLAPLDPIAYLLGFVAFRVFDILKPWPAGWLDRQVSGAFGVLIDDVAAAIYAGFVLVLIVRLMGL